MKRLMLLLVAILIVVITVCVVYAGSNKIDVSVSEMPKIDVRHAEEISWAENPWPSYIEVINEYGINQNSRAELDVPVYYEEDLLFNLDSEFQLNRDASFHYGTSIALNDASTMFARYPTDAIRVREDGTVYAVYDTDTGYRLYVFCEKRGEGSNYGVTLGFPVVIGEMLSYQDFAELKIGDDIGKVECIDEVATLHKKFLLDIAGTSHKMGVGLAASGHPCTSIHYLSDGILKIEYEMLEDRSLIISNIIYNKDYQITDAIGRVVDHRIEPVDLP